MLLLCVRWYLRYALGYRDMEEFAQERGLSVHHTTVFRWVQRYAPEVEKQCRPHPKATTDAYRQDDETMPMLRKGQLEEIAKGDVLVQDQVLNQRFGLLA